MKVDSDRATQILLEVCINGTKKSPQDTPEEALVRQRYAADVADIAKRGGVVDIPGEMPDIS